MDLLLQTKEWDSGESFIHANNVHICLYPKWHSFHQNIKGISDTKQDENKNTYEN